MQFERFKLVDRILEINTAERTIRCEAIVPTESSILDHHFPGHPLMPGVLMLESMAQTSGWMILGVQGFRKMPFLAAAREAKFRTFVEPGTRLELTAKMVHDGSGFALTQAQGTHDGQTRSARPIRRAQPLDSLLSIAAGRREVIPTHRRITHA